MRLRQVALVAANLKPVMEEIRAVLGLNEGYHDPGVGKYGLENEVLAIGDTFLEVVVPRQPGTTAGRLLEKRAGDGGYMVILQVDDIAASRALAEQRQARVVDRIDGKGFWATHLHPKDVGGAILSLDAMEPVERWEWAGPRWEDRVDTSVTLGITGVELQSDAPDQMAHRWSEVLGAPAEATGSGFEIPLDRSTIRFVWAKDRRGDGVSAFDVAVRDVAEVRRRAEVRGCLDAGGNVVLSGTRVYLAQG
ncbi:MAG: VOC family protein [Dehalococcoidia bacterium]